MEEKSAETIFQDLGYYITADNEYIREYHNKDLDSIIQFMKDIEQFCVLGGAYQNIIGPIQQQCREFNWE